MTERLSRFEMPPTERNRLLREQTVVHTRCRVCQSMLIPAFDLGELFVSDFPARLEDRGPKVSLRLAVCSLDACGLVQLTHTVPRDALYRTHYWYRSGVNESMRRELNDVVQWGLLWLGPLEEDDIVIDIGANDGTLLEEADRLSQSRCGFAPRLWAVEPSPTFTDTLLEGVVERVIADYFPPRLPGYVTDYDWQRLQAKLIFSVAMFYDLEDPNAFVAEIKRILAPDGVWVVQMGDLLSMLRTTGFDTICHEHLEYYSLSSFMRLIERHGLEVLGVQQSAANGGSLRVAVRHASGARSRSGREIRVQLDAEHALMPDGPLQAVVDFGQQVHRVCSRVQQVLLRYLGQDGTFELLGASTKGNTLLQRLNIGPELALRALERSPEKHGRLTVTGIPIVDETRNPDPPAGLRLVLPWHFRDGLIARAVNYTKNGGRLLFPLPEVELFPAGKEQ